MHISLARGKTEMAKSYGAALAREGLLSPQQKAPVVIGAPTPLGLGMKVEVECVNWDF